MIGFNGGLIGKDRTTSFTDAVGVWTLDEQIKAQRSNVWPLLVDPDALAYINAVETADGQTLEAGVRTAINTFVVSCKLDGIWNAIKASCILAGARTLTGALTPLVGTAPTNNNFVSGDYNRETGLVGDGSTKYLNSNRNNNADPQNSSHNAAYITNTGVAGGAVIAGGVNAAGDNYIDLFFGSATRHANRNATNQTNGTYSTGFTGTSRSSSGLYSYRVPGDSGTRSLASQTPSSTVVTVFARAAGASGFADHRLAFYSIGESLDLALLDARVSTLISDIAAAIP